MKKRLLIIIIAAALITAALLVFLPRRQLSFSLPESTREAAKGLDAVLLEMTFDEESGALYGQEEITLT
ncbi:MAG: hypothetical protein PHU22_08185, partial [Eubacteriales bacterium]|nr:hypothetical protein [Eubacteriales bacterium]